MIDSSSRRITLPALVCAALCNVGALIVAPPARAAAGADASPVGDAAIALPMETGMITMVIAVADANVPAQTDSKTFNSDTTKDGIREASTSTHTTTYTITPGHVTADVQIVATGTLTNVATGAGAGRKTSKGNGHFDIDACPDVNGLSKGHVTLAIEQETTAANGQRSGGVASAEGPIRLSDGDDAHLLRSEMDVQMAANIHGYDAQKPFQAGISQYMPMSISSTGSLTVNEVGFTQQLSGDVDKYKPANSLGLMELLFMSLAGDIAKETEKFWRSGKCIKLNPSEKSRDVKPQEQLSITVAAVHKIDAQEVKAPIQAEISGVQSVDPDSKPIDSPATFTFIAGPNTDDRATIALLQVGKRGIGKESLNFHVKCPAMTVAYDGTFTLSGLGNTQDVRLALTPTTLLACDKDGLYRVDAEMSVQGDLLGHGCHAAIKFPNAVAIVVQLDETDPSQVRIGITPAIPDIGMTVLSCPKNVRPFPVNVAFTDLWGRMMANRPVKIGQASVITAEIAQGAGRARTTTKITVTRPEDSPH